MGRMESHWRQNDWTLRNFINFLSVINTVIVDSLLSYSFLGNGGQGAETEQRFFLLIMHPAQAGESSKGASKPK